VLKFLGVPNWVLATVLLVFLLGLFLGARIPFPHRSAGTAKDARRSQHYIRGMYAMLTSDPESAISHLSRVVELSTEPIEVYLALGNLFRQRGQIDRAIRVHQSLLTRAGLSEEEKVLALNALGMDFKTGGLMDRAVRTFKDALALNPKDPDALAYLVRLSEDLGEWGDAYEYATRLQKVRGRKDPKTLSYLLAQKAGALREGGPALRAAWQLHRALRLHPENTLATLHLVRLYLAADKPQKALKALEKALGESPHKSFMLLPALREVYQRMGDGEGYLETLHRLGFEQGQKRALLLELEEWLARGERDRVAELTRHLVRHFGRSRQVQRTLWGLLRKGAVEESLAAEWAETLSRSEQMADPFVCISCGYRTLEILHRCPNCKEWDSFADGEG